jgi:hypothetical protein
MIALLLLNLGEKNPKKVTIQMTFEAQKGQNPSLEELNEFLDAVSKVHEYAILNTQPEYADIKTPIMMNNSKVLDYHKLEVKHLCRKNPFDIELTFYLVQEGLITYWPFIKALMEICKRYGKNVNILEETFQNIRALFDYLYAKYHRNLLLSLLSRSLRYLDDRTELFEKISRKFTLLMANHKFREYYDKFCSTSITITNLVSLVEDLNEKIDLLND